MKTNSLISIVFLLLFAISSNAGLIDKLISYKDNIINAFNEENVKMNIYVGGSDDNDVDVYYNKRDISNKKEVVIFVHGGAWLFGSKYQNSKIGSFLCKEGYVAVIPNYVKYPKGKIDDMVEDVYKTVEWTYNNISKYGGDRTKIILSGHSAGAHLSALTVIKSYLKMENHDYNLSPLPKLDKLVLFNGPYDFDDYDVITKFFTQSDVDRGIAEVVVSKLFASDDVSPTDIVKSQKSNSISDFGVPKIVFFYCDKDQIVPESSANKLIKEIRRVSPKTVINYIYNRGNNLKHSTLIDGARSGDENMEQYFLEIIKS